jgi:hypothetical protein
MRGDDIGVDMERDRGREGLDLEWEARRLTSDGDV